MVNNEILKDLKGENGLQLPPINFYQRNQPIALKYSNFMKWVYQALNEATYISPYLW